MSRLVKFRFKKSLFGYGSPCRTGDDTEDEHIHC